MSFGLIARAAATTLVAARLARGLRGAPPISESPGLDSDERDFRISVVIAARNEAERVARTVRSVAGAPGVFEVIVVDDESTDDTWWVAQLAGARIVGVGVRPEGWAGKAWALDCGVRAAEGDWVVTLDADAVASPELPQVIVERLMHEDIDLMTVAGGFGSTASSAQWLHAAMLTTLVYRFGIPGASMSPRREIANGQCMAFHRATFLAWGGFASVAGSPVEDVALARELAACGRRVAFVDATSFLTIEPYPSFGSTWRGWGRSLGLPSVDTDLQRALDVMVLGLTTIAPLGRLARGRVDGVDIAALMLRLGTLIGTRRAYADAGPAYWLSPLADSLALGAVVGGFRRQQSWKGRSYATPGVPARSAAR